MKLWTAIHHDFIAGEGDFLARKSGWDIIPGLQVSSYARGGYYRWQGNSIFCEPDGAILSRRFSYLKPGDKLYEASLIKRTYSDVVPHNCLNNCTRAIWPKRTNDTDKHALLLICNDNGSFSMDVEPRELNDPAIINYATYASTSRWCCNLWFAIALIENNGNFYIYNRSFFNQDGDIS